MDRQEMKFAVVIKGNEVLQIGKSVIYQPLIDYKGKETRWFDDTRLIKKSGAA